jgi:hypothetical protein
MPGMTRSEQAQTVLMHNALWHRALIDNAEKQLVNNAGSVRYEDFQRIQAKLIEVRRKTLNGVLDLMTAGLTVPEDISTMLSGYENINEFQRAKVSMNPEALQNNSTDFAQSWVPLPIVHQGWKIPFRQMGFAYKNQVGMSESARQVAEGLEEILFLGSSEIKVSFQGATQSLYGYTNHPNRLTKTIVDWTDMANRTAIITQSVEMIGQMYDAASVSQPNSVVMYVATDIWTGLQEDYSTVKGDKTLKERIEAITEISAVKPALKLAAGEVVLVEMSDRTITLAVASDIVTIPHVRESEMADQVFTTYAAMTPQIKVDRNGKTGILHAST